MSLTPGYSRVDLQLYPDTVFGHTAIYPDTVFGYTDTPVQLMTWYMIVLQGQVNLGLSIKLLYLKVVLE